MGRQAARAWWGEWNVVNGIGLERVLAEKATKPLTQRRTLMTTRVRRTVALLAWMALIAPSTALAASDPHPHFGGLPVVVKALELTPEQAEGLGQLLTERQEAWAPLLAEISALESKLESLIEAGEDPPQIGVLVLEIRNRQERVAEIQQTFLEAFHALLSDPQKERLTQIRIAAKLAQVVPAFSKLRLL